MTIKLLNQLPEQIVKVGIDWQQFKAIQSAFDSIPGVRLNYCEAELEIVGISKEHEALRCLLALLLGAYFEKMDFYLLAHCLLMSSSLEALRTLRISDRSFRVNDWENNKQCRTVAIMV